MSQQMEIQYNNYSNMNFIKFTDVADVNSLLTESAKHVSKTVKTRMWANAQRDGRPAEHRWRPLFNVAKFG